MAINFLRSATAAGLLIAASSAHAAGVTITEYDPLDYPGVDDFIVGSAEDFEPALPDGVAGPEIDDTDTFDVGVFNAISGVGSGGTVDGTCDGSKLCIRSGNVHGRENVIPDDGGHFLDSNDTHGIGWTVSNEGESFNTVTFTLMDARDQGAFSVVAASTEQPDSLAEVDVLGLDFAFVPEPTNNGNIKTVVVQFDEWITEAFIAIASFRTENGEFFRTNDGLGIDGVQVGVAPVPVPAAGVLLLGALGGLGFAARRRRKS